MTNTRHEILFLAHRIPYPPDKGDKIRSYRLLRFLCKHFDVHLAAFVDDPRDFAHRGTLEEIAASVTLLKRPPKISGARAFLQGRSVSEAIYESNEMRQKVKGLRARPIVAEIAFSSTMAQYLEPEVANRPRLIDLCDADSAKWDEYAQQKGGLARWFYGREAAQLRLAEARAINNATRAFAISKAEAAVLDSPRRAESLAPKPVSWFGNGVDTAFFSPRENMATPPGPDIVFTGAMDYWANVDAALWFVDRVWPLVLKTSPQAQFAIVGSRPDKRLMALHGRKNISVTGRVPDVRPYLWGAKIAIAPMRIARGVQNKVLEAMASGVPVVATSGAATGIEMSSPTHFMLADAAEDFVNAVTALLANPDERSRLAREGRALMVNQFQWDQQLGRFADELIGLGLIDSRRASDQDKKVAGE